LQVSRKGLYNLGVAKQVLHLYDSLRNGLKCSKLSRSICCCLSTGLRSQLLAGNLRSLTVWCGLHKQISHTKHEVQVVDESLKHFCFRNRCSGRFRSSWKTCQSPSQRQLPVVRSQRVRVSSNPEYLVNIHICKMQIVFQISHVIIAVLRSYKVWVLHCKVCHYLTG